MKYLMWTGWVAALLIAIATLIERDENKKEIARANFEASRLQLELDSAEDILAGVSESLDWHKKRLKDVNARVEELAAKVPSETTATTAPAVPENFDPAGLLESMLDKGDDGDASPMAAMMDMFKGEQGEKYAEMSAGYAVNMQYADLFRALGLDADTEATVRDIMKQSMVEQMQQGFAMMENMEDADFKSMAEETLDGQARMREALAEVLTPEELDQYDAYQEEMPRRMLKQSYDMQLGMMAPGLDGDTRGFVTEVLADEMVALQQPENIPEDIGSMTEMQRAAFDRAMDRLAADLDEQQLDQVQSFVDQQLSFMELGMGMFRGAESEEPATAQ